MYLREGLGWIGLDGVDWIVLDWEAERTVGLRPIAKAAVGVISFLLLVRGNQSGGPGSYFMQAGEGLLYYCC